MSGTDDQQQAAIGNGLVHDGHMQKRHSSGEHVNVSV